MPQDPQYYQPYDGDADADGYPQQPSYPYSEIGYAPQNSFRQDGYGDPYSLPPDGYPESGYAPQNVPRQGGHSEPYGLPPDCRDNYAMPPNGQPQDGYGVPYGQPAEGRENPYRKHYQNAPDFRQYPFGGDFLDEAAHAPRREDAEAVKHRGLAAVLAVFVIVCIAGIVLFSKVLRVTSVTVSGLTSLQAADVAHLAGLDIGRSYLGIDENKVREKVESNRYLVFVSLEKRFPNAVILNVRERVARVNLMVMGVTYVLDEDGMVLERMNSVSLDNDLPTVTGMQAREVRVGRVLAAQKETQLSGMHSVLEELVLQGCIGEISEINLSSMESVYLTTRDGYTVNIGGTDDLRAKIGTMRAVVAKLREMGKSGGVIDATVPGEATYSPEGL